MGRTRNHELRAQQDTYRKFKAYIETELRDADNPELTVIKFDDMKPPTTVYMELELIGVNRVVSPSDWERTVRSFREGTRLESEPGIYDNAQTYVAYVPFEDPEQLQPRSGRYDEVVPRGGPDPFKLILWLIALLLLVVVSAFKIPPDEWGVLSALFF